MKVVVTGGAGFIGANLCRALATDPAIDSVLALDDLSSGHASNLDGVDATLVRGSILDLALLDECLSGAAAVVHLAALASVPLSIDDPLRTHEVNVTGTLAVLEAARRAGDAHVVVASSAAVYGAEPALPNHEGLAPAPVSPYAASKLATEAYALSHQQAYRLPVLALRFFNIYGPWQPPGHVYSAAIPAFVSAALADEPVRIFGDGKQTRDFTHVDTVTSVLTSAVTRRVTHDGPVNLAGGSTTDLLTVIDVLGELLGAPVPVSHEPERAGDVRHSHADNALLLRLFPELTPVPLADGLRATIDWFRR